MTSDPDGPEAFDGTLMDGLEDEPSSLFAFRADAAVAAVLVKHRGMTPEQAVAEVRKGKPECLCRCGAAAIGADGEGRWACGLHIAPR